jgi:hypothetical protein
MGAGPSRSSQDHAGVDAEVHRVSADGDLAGTHAHSKAANTAVININRFNRKGNRRPPGPHATAG